MTSPPSASAPPLDAAWTWPLDPHAFDRTPTLSAVERAALAPFAERGLRRRLPVLSAARTDRRLARLVRPLEAALADIDGDERSKEETAFLLLHECARLGQPFWAWSPSTWRDIISPTQQAFLVRHKPGNQTHLRQYVIATAYLLDLFRDVHTVGGLEMARLARKVFGTARLATLLAPVIDATRNWGYRPGREAEFVAVVATALLRNGHPDPRRLGYDLLADLHGLLAPSPQRRAMVYRLSRILAHLGWLSAPLPLSGGLPEAVYREDRERGIAPAWVAWAQRWFDTSTRSPRTRRHIRGDLLRVGRWLAAHHPTVSEPGQWTRELAAAFVAAVDRMHSGDFAQTTTVPLATRGQPFSPQRKDSLLSALRCSFADAQEWGWIARRFDAQRAFATPRSVRLLLGPAPRIIADEVWAKLLWAGLNLTPADCPPLGRHQGTPRREATDPRVPLTFYPPAMIRALALLWLFAGLRSDELMRLRVGCVRFQAVVGGAGAADTAAPAGCLLDVPVNKTGSAFTKPVDPLVGEAVAAWEAERPAQPELLDPKTGARVAFLFCYRAKRLSRAYLNHSLMYVIRNRITPCTWQQDAGYAGSSQIARRRETA